MTAVDRRTDKRNVVIQPLGKDGRLAARLIVDQDHPYFFDHPLDHAPGLLLLEGAVQLAQTRAAGPSFVSRIDASFIRYALFGSPISLTAQVSSEGERRRFLVSIKQNGRLRARIVVELSDYLGPFSRRFADRRAPVEPCAMDAVNKIRPENVLIGVPRITPPGIETQILPPPPDCRMSDTAGVIHPLYLLESFMQLQRYLNRIRRDQARMRDILTGVAFEQVAPIDHPKTPLSILGGDEFVETSRRRLARSAAIEAGGRSFAECTIHTARAGQHKITA